MGSLSGFGKCGTASPPFFEGSFGGSAGLGGLELLPKAMGIEIGLNIRKLLEGLPTICVLSHAALLLYKPTNVTEAKNLPIFCKFANCAKLRPFIVIPVSFTSIIRTRTFNDAKSSPFSRSIECGKLLL